MCSWTLLLLHVDAELEAEEAEDAPVTPDSSLHGPAAPTTMNIYFNLRGQFARQIAEDRVTQGM